MGKLVSFGSKKLLDMISIRKFVQFLITKPSKIENALAYSCSAKKSPN